MTIIFYCWLLPILIGCQLSPMDLQQKNSIIGKWEVVKYEEQNEHGKWDLINQPDTSDCFNKSCSVIINFHNDSIFEGHTVTNKISGSYIIKEGNKLKIKRFGGTKINEPDWALKFWDVFPKIESYQIIKGKLILFYGAPPNKIVLNPHNNENK